MTPAALARGGEVARCSSKQSHSRVFRCVITKAAPAAAGIPARAGWPEYGYGSFLDALAQRFHVYAPLVPGYGDSDECDELRDMLDFTLHTWDVVARWD